MIDALLSRIPSDALLDAAAKIAERQIAPLFDRVRDELLARVIGSPPPTFISRLQQRGFPIDEATANVLWQEFVRAHADTPIDSVGGSTTDAGAAE